jgi:hypothetical protein
MRGSRSGRKQKNFGEHVLGAEKFRGARSGSRENSGSTFWEQRKFGEHVLEAEKIRGARSGSRENSGSTFWEQRKFWEQTVHTQSGSGGGWGRVGPHTHPHKPSHPRSQPNPHPNQKPNPNPNRSHVARTRRRLCVGEKRTTDNGPANRGLHVNASLMVLTQYWSLTAGPSSVSNTMLAIKQPNTRTLEKEEGMGCV